MFGVCCDGFVIVDVVMLLLVYFDVSWDVDVLIVIDGWYIYVLCFGDVGQVGYNDNWFFVGLLFGDQLYLCEIVLVLWVEVIVLFIWFVLKDVGIVVLIEVEICDVVILVLDGDDLLYLLCWLMKDYFWCSEVLVLGIIMCMVDFVVFD